MENHATRQRSACQSRCLAEHRPWWLTIAAIAVLFVCAADSSNSSFAEEARKEIKAADTSSPRDTLKTFIDACNELHELIQEYQYFDRYAPEHAQLSTRILDCLDVSELPAFARRFRAGEVAACLKEIIDREELPPWDQIPDTEEIRAAGGPEKFTQWRIPGTRITIARVEQGPQRHEYLFSPGTVDRAVSYFKEIKPRTYRTEGPEVSENIHDWYVSAPGDRRLAKIVSMLPERLQRGQILGLPAWKLIGIILALPITIVFMATAYRLQTHFTQNWREKGLRLYWLTILFPIAAMIAPLVLKNFSQDYLTIRGNPLYVIRFCTIATALFAALVVIFGLSNRIAESIINSPRINPQGLNAQLVRIVSKLSSFTAAIVLFLVGGQYLGIPVATLLASAGIGGVAVALGAQDTLKTLFGTMMLMADKPFRVGERIILGKYDGVVEDIGLRSTTVRLLTGHQITIPNDQLSRGDIENVGQRPHIRRLTDIHVPLDTPRESLEKAISIIREALQSPEVMDIEFPPRVFFMDFAPTAFIIRMIYWYKPPKYWKFLEFGEKVNLQILRAFEEQGIQLSLPFRVAHTSIDGEEQPIQIRTVDS